MLVFIGFLFMLGAIVFLSVTFASTEGWPYKPLPLSFDIGFWGFWICVLFAIAFFLASKLS